MILAVLKVIGRILLLWMIIILLFTAPRKFIHFDWDVLDDIIPLVLVFAVPATPALVLRRLVVRPDFPFVGPGYVFVLLYGLAFAGFLTASTMPRSSTVVEDLLCFWRTLASYELAAIPVTLVYAFLEPRLGLGDRRAREVKVAGQEDPV